MLTGVLSASTDPMEVSIVIGVFSGVEVFCGSGLSGVLGSGAEGSGLRGIVGILGAGLSFWSARMRSSSRVLK